MWRDVAVVIGVAAAGCAPDVASRQQAIATVDAASEPLPYPESGECGYVRPVLGQRPDGRPLYGPPVLDQNNCPDGMVCGRPEFDGCTEYEAERMTCGCVAAAAACDPATLAAGLASSEWRVREESQARAMECCGSGPEAFMNALTGAVNGLNSLEASTRLQAVRNACMKCTMDLIPAPDIGGGTPGPGFFVPATSTCGTHEYCNSGTCVLRNGVYECRCSAYPLDGGMPSYCDVSVTNGVRTLYTSSCRDDLRCDLQSAACAPFDNTTMLRCPCTGPAFPSLADGQCRWLEVGANAWTPGPSNCPEGYGCPLTDDNCTDNGDGSQTCTCVPTGPVGQEAAAPL